MSKSEANNEQMWMN